MHNNFLYTVCLFLRTFFQKEFKSKKLLKHSFLFGELCKEKKIMKRKQKVINMRIANFFLYIKIHQLLLWMFVPTRTFVGVFKLTVVRGKLKSQKNFFYNEESIHFCTTIPLYSKFINTFGHLLKKKIWKRRVGNKI